MKMIDVTNSHYELVKQQLENTDAQVVKVYTIGPSTVIYTQAPLHQHIVIINKHRDIKQKEIDFTIQRLFKLDNSNDVDILEGPNFVELEYYAKGTLF